MNDIPEPQKIRVFFALWPTEAERAALIAWQPVLARCCEGRAMRSDTLHVTLAFLGEVDVARQGELRQAADEVDGVAFELHFDQVRYWQHNHIVYAVPTNIPEPLSLLVAQLERSLSRYHFRFDRREYTPHVTLLRNAAWADARSPAIPAVQWHCHEFVLLASAPTERGAHYTALARFPLKA